VRGNIERHGTPELSSKQLGLEYLPNFFPATNGTFSESDRL
jgi:hypothetical protein